MGGGFHLSFILPCSIGAGLCTDIVGRVQISPPATLKAGRRRDASLSQRIRIIFLASLCPEVSRIQ